MIKPQLLKEELVNHDRQDEKLRNMTTIKRVNTDEEVHFERRDEELSKSTDNVNLKPCNIIKILWNYKVTFIFGILVTILYGVFPVLRGYFMGKGINALNSKYQTVIYDDGLKFAIIYLIMGIFNAASFVCSYAVLYRLGIDLTKIYRNYLLKKYLSLHMAFFDIDRNTPGSLLSRMAIDTVQLQYSFKLIFGNILFFFIYLNYNINFWLNL